MLTYQRSEDESDREDAAHYLEGVRQRFGKFSNEVGKLPKTVREAQPIALALQIQQCFDVLTKSLAYRWKDNQFQDGIRLTEWICECLLECLTRADAILEQYFKNKHQVR